MKKVAVMLPIAYLGGSLRAAKNIVKSIAFQAQEHGENIQVIFSYVKTGKYNLRVDFDDLIKAGIVLRETEWKIYPVSQLLGAAFLIGLDPAKLEFPFYCLPSDGANDFFDCDLWLIISDRLQAPLFPLRKTAFIVYDYIQRYVPEIFGGSDELWNSQVSNLMYSIQHSARVFVTTPSTKQDMISYAGVKNSHIQLLDMEFQPLEPPTEKNYRSLKFDYVVWATNLSYHKNHINAFDAIEIYLQDFDGSLDFVITGNSTEYFDPENDYPENDPVLHVIQVDSIRKKLKKNKSLAKRIHILGNVSDKIYAQYLKNARFLWNPALYDNGTYAVLEAAYLGVPSLSARYPAMEYMNRAFKLSIQFCDPRNPKEMAETLYSMESAAHYMPLPSQEELRRHDWKSLSLPLYQAVTELMW